LVISGITNESNPIAKIGTKIAITNGENSIK
jgi:hypothetical protein